MNKLESIKSLVAVAGLSILTTGIAAAANLSVVHGIPGKELGVDRSLPVDVSVNGSCTLEGFEFGSIAGPLTVDAGTYDIEISLADTANPCQGALALSGSINLALGEDATVVAHYTRDGSISISKFTNDVRPTDSGNSRFVARHLADAPDVDVDFAADGQPTATVAGLGFSQQGKADLAAHNYDVSVRVAGTDITALGPYNIDSAAAVGYFVHVVGSVGNGTLVPLVQVIDL